MKRKKFLIAGFGSVGSAAAGLIKIILLRILGNLDGIEFKD